MTRPDRVGVVAWHLRTEPACWLLPVSVVLGYLAAMGIEGTVHRYPLADAVRAHGSIIVLAPLGAGCAAWRAGSYRRGGWHQRRWPRSHARRAATEILSTAAVQLVAYLVAALAAAPRSDAPGLPLDPQLLLVAAASLLGWTALGYAVGWWARPELAMPTVILGSYLAIVFPVAIEPLWVRHLAGTYLGCCSPDRILDPAAVRAPVLLALGVAGAGVLLVAARERAWTAFAAVAIVAVTASAAVAQVDHLGPDPIAPRLGTVACQGTEPTVCTWPEQEDARDHIAEVARSTLARWSAAGLEVPDRVSTRPFADDIPTIVIFVAPQPTGSEIVRALAAGAVPFLDCPEAIPTDVYEASDIARAVLAVLGGLDPSELVASDGPEIASQVARVQAADPAARTDWLARVVEAVTTCAPGAPEPPG